MRSSSLHDQGSDSQGSRVREYAQGSSFNVQIKGGDILDELQNSCVERGQVGWTSNSVVK